MCVCVGGWRDEGVRGVCVCHTFCVHDITDTDLGTLKLPLVLLLLYILSLCVCLCVTHPVFMTSLIQTWIH